MIKSGKIKSLLRVSTAKDLCDCVTLQNINDYLCELYLKSEKKTILEDYYTLCPKVLREYLFLSSDNYSIYKDIISKRSIDEKKRERSRVKKLKSKFTVKESTLSVELYDKMKEKFIQLMGS